jgi:hypothetical protein
MLTDTASAWSTKSRRCVFASKKKFCGSVEKFLLWSYLALDRRDLLPHYVTLYLLFFGISSVAFYCILTAVDDNFCFLRLEFMGIHLDTDVIYLGNRDKGGVTRKNGCIINTGSTTRARDGSTTLRCSGELTLSFLLSGNPTNTERTRKIEENRRRYEDGKVNLAPMRSKLIGLLIQVSTFDR